MKTSKKILGVVVACCMLLTMAAGALSVSAADAEPLVDLSLTEFAGNTTVSEEAKAAFAAVDPDMNVWASQASWTGGDGWWKAAQIQVNNNAVFADIPDDSQGISFYVYITEESYQNTMQVKLTVAGSEVYSAKMKPEKGKVTAVNLKWEDFKLDTKDPNPPSITMEAVKAAAHFQFELYSNTGNSDSDAHKLYYAVGDVYEYGALGGAEPAPETTEAAGTEAPATGEPATEGTTEAPATEAPATEAPAADVTLSFEAETGKSAGEELKVEIVSPVAKVESFDMEVTYDTEKLEYVKAVAGAANEGASVLGNEPNGDGKILLSGANPYGSGEAGSIVTLTFKVKEGIADGETAAMSGVVNSMTVAGEKKTGAMEGAELTIGEVEEPSESETSAGGSEDPTTTGGSNVGADENPDTGAAAPMGAAALAVAAVAAIVVLKKRK